MLLDCDGQHGSCLYLQTHLLSIIKRQSNKSLAVSDGAMRDMGKVVGSTPVFYTLIGNIELMFPVFCFHGCKLFILFLFR